MDFHKVPENLDPLDVPVVEGVVVAIVGVALDHLLVIVTTCPQLTHPPMTPVHVGGVLPGLRVTVHMLSDPGDVVHLDMVIPPIIGDHGVVGAGAQVSRQLRGEGDGVVIEAVEVNDADGGIGFAYFYTFHLKLSYKISRQPDVSVDSSPGPLPH